MMYELKYSIMDKAGVYWVKADSEPQAVEQLIEWLGCFFIYSDILGIREMEI